MPMHTDNISVDDGFDALDYNYASYNTRSFDTTVRGERHLWCAVIHQAFLDLEDKNACDEAKRWLLRDKKDFVLVCSLAGFSPLLVRMAALRQCEGLTSILPEEPKATPSEGVSV